MSNMTVPLLDLKGQIQELRDEMLKEITEILDSAYYIMGPKVQELEKAVCEYAGVSEAIAVSSGTDALLLALMALDIGPGDSVITTDFSFFATAGVIARCHARPVFVDIDPVTFNIDPVKLEETLQTMSDEVRRSVKAIIPVHLYGQCANMNAIQTIAQQYNIPIIEDSAQAIGAEYRLDGKALQTGNLGDMACFSFFPTKNLGGIGDAGMVVTNNEELAHTLRIKRNHGAEPKYYHKVIGGNFRIDTIQAAVILVKLPHLNQWHQARQHNAEVYNRLFSEAGIEKVKCPKAVYKDDNLTNYHIYNQYKIRVPQRNDLRKFLADNNIGSEVYYPVPFHAQECFQYLGYRTPDFPESTKASNEVLALPIYPELTEPMQEYVVSKIKEFYQKYGM